MSKITPPKLKSTIPSLEAIGRPLPAEPASPPAGFTPPWLTPEAVAPLVAAADAVVIPPLPTTQENTFTGKWDSGEFRETHSLAVIPPQAVVERVEVEVTVEPEVPFVPETAMEKAFVQAYEEQFEGKLPEPAVTTIQAETPVVNGFLIENTPIAKERQKRTCQYPFEVLQVGQSFFVAGKTAKQMASTVGSANKRYSVEDLTAPPRKVRGKEYPALKQERTFACANETKNGVAGVRIGRTA